MIKTSPKGLALIQQHIPLRRQAWLNPETKQWTIGYGHTDGVRRGDDITPYQATEYLKEDLRLPEKAVAQQIQLIRLRTFFTPRTPSPANPSQSPHPTPDYSWLRDRAAIQQHFDTLVCYAFRHGLDAFYASDLLKRSAEGRREEGRGLGD